MFKDTQKELERLEAELLAQQPEDEEEPEEDWEDEDDLLDDDDDIEEAPVYRNFSNRYRAYNTDRTDWDPEELAEELEEPRKPSIWGWCALALTLVACILLVLVWWAIRFYGGAL